ncbi:hypothetical protein J3E69DRAFT_367255 [Trichoderma sp. SZMC 28015]
MNLSPPRLDSKDSGTDQRSSRSPESLFLQPCTLRCRRQQPATQQSIDRPLNPTETTDHKAMEHQGRMTGLCAICVQKISSRELVEELPAQSQSTLWADACLACGRMDVWRASLAYWEQVMALMVNLWKAALDARAAYVHHLEGYGREAGYGSWGDTDSDDEGLALSSTELDGTLAALLASLQQTREEAARFARKLVGWSFAEYQAEAAAREVHNLLDEHHRSS